MMNATMLKSLNKMYYFTRFSTAHEFLSIDEKLSQLLRIKNNKNLIKTPKFETQIRCKSYKRFLDFSKVPTLNEHDLEEQFVRGSGPGGQATNKTSNAVSLKHNPTGLIVKCHKTRSLIENRKRAREIMVTKLDNLLNGKDSIESQEEELRKRDTTKKKQKQRKWAELKKSFEERENIE